MVVRLRISAEDFAVHRLAARRKWARRVARRLVVNGDGAEWICQGGAQGPPGHTFQLDRWPLVARITQCAGQVPQQRWKRLRRWVFAGRMAARIRPLRPLVGAPTPAAKQLGRSAGA
jgi:hypothetical protein